jgi:hypothetical protein
MRWTRQGRCFEQKQQFTIQILGTVQRHQHVTERYNYPTPADFQSYTLIRIVWRPLFPQFTQISALAALGDVLVARYRHFDHFLSLINYDVF